MNAVGMIEDLGNLSCLWHYYQKFYVSANL
jgi:hypothetical protein